MWIKDYLSFGPNHPLWAHFADAIIAKNAYYSPIVKPAAKINTFYKYGNL
jgi:hypothetical protein